MRSHCVSERSKIMERLFPNGVPKLWCPLLTHYTSEGKIDRARMEAHLKQLSPWVKAYLIPGSTGDGWEMTDEEIKEVLGITLELAKDYNVQVLVGILKTERGAARQGILDMLDWLKKRTGISDLAECLKAAKVCGFTVCPPKGRHLAQDEIKSELASVLRIGVPTALYQLPQITENEMSPETVASLASDFSNFYLFKDTSGKDSVVLSGCDLGGVFLVRGAEGNYDHWLRTGNSGYHGFLLSTANCFAAELHAVIHHIMEGKIDAAKELSGRLSGAVSEVFQAVAAIPQGNAFTNANKAMDHILAYGVKALAIPGPRLHAGISIPEDRIRTTSEILERYHLLSEKGYFG